MTVIVFLAPVCPWCGQLPCAVIGNGTQAFCGNHECPALIWNPSVTAAANLANPRDPNQGDRS